MIGSWFHHTLYTNCHSDGRYGAAACLYIRPLRSDVECVHANGENLPKNDHCPSVSLKRSSESHCTHRKCTPPPPRTGGLHWACVVRPVSLPDVSSDVLSILPLPAAAAAAAAAVTTHCNPAHGTVEINPLPLERVKFNFFFYPFEV